MPAAVMPIATKRGDKGGGAHAGPSPHPDPSPRGRGGRTPRRNFPSGRGLGWIPRPHFALTSIPKAGPSVAFGVGHILRRWPGVDVAAGRTARLT